MGSSGFLGWSMRSPSGHEVLHGVLRKPGNGTGASTVVTERLRLPLCGHLLNVILHPAGFPDSIAPASPIHAKPVISFNTRLKFELEFAEWRAAVGLCCAFDFLENV